MSTKAVRSKEQSLHFVYMLQAERLNQYVTYLLLIITLLGESNSSTEKGAKCLQLSAS